MPRERSPASQRRMVTGLTSDLSALAQQNGYGHRSGSVELAGLVKMIESAQRCGVPLETISSTVKPVRKRYKAFDENAGEQAFDKLVKEAAIASDKLIDSLNGNSGRKRRKAPTATEIAIAFLLAIVCAALAEVLILGIMH